mmetsp:Transcript_10675/g.21930  ORF Transcript_10675/g.21930 Transcript_10675/m.21930 type:complete len:205 (+) Transcript_10675:520-1134(+)
MCCHDLHGLPTENLLQLNSPQHRTKLDTKVIEVEEMLQEFEGIDSVRICDRSRTLFSKQLVKFLLSVACSLQCARRIKRFTQQSIFVFSRFILHFFDVLYILFVLHAQHLRSAAQWSKTFGMSSIELCLKLRGKKTENFNASLQNPFWGQLSALAVQNKASQTFSNWNRALEPPPNDSLIPSIHSMEISNIIAVGVRSCPFGIP